MQHQPIEELELFAIYESVSDWIWEIVDQWSLKAQDTIGKQIIRAADSINANLVEGDGRYTIADSIRFFVIARASARETRLWINRAAKRKLIKSAEGVRRIKDLETATRMLNKLISYRRSAKFTKETRSKYRTNPLEED